MKIFILPFLTYLYICDEMNFTTNIGSAHWVIVIVFLISYLFIFLRYLRIRKSIRVHFFKFFLKFVLRSIYLLLILIASLGPHIPEASSPKEVDDIGKDIFFALDLSKSMNAKDIAPSRIEKAKYELLKIANAFATDRLGLIIFSESAYLQTPLTFDKAAFQLYLETTSTDLVPGGGTDFSGALKMALDKQTINEAIDEKAKIIVLVSDGEDFGEETIDMAEDLKKEEIKLFTIGIGTSEGAKIPKGRSFIKENGKPVISKLNAKSLKKLSKLTGGKYYEISKHKNQTERVIRDIKKIKGTTRDTVELDAPKNSQFEFFLIPALFLMLLDLFFTFKLVKI